MAPLTLFRHIACAALLASTVSGCGSDAETAEPPPRQAAEATDPLAEIPLEELYGASAVDNLWSPRFELEVLDLPQGWNGARIAVVSDLQLGLWDGNEAVAAAAIQLAVAANPDLVFLLGDYLARGADTESLARVLTPLRGRRSVAVLGDRDIRSDSLEAAIVRTLQASSAQVLNNSVVGIELNGDMATIAGLAPDLLSMTTADQQWILATLGNEGAAPIILLTHAPTLATRAPTGRFPIVVGGNTFCGGTEVPGTPRLEWLRTEALPGGAIEGMDRIFRVQGSTLFVTCGVGYGFVPLRFGAAPEVPILTLRRAGTPVAPAVSGPAVEDTMIQRFQTAPADTL